MPRQINTKEKILECAFGLYEKPRMSEISLSEIAAKAGISKTAIFRHYKNKEELMEKSAYTEVWGSHSGLCMVELKFY